MWAVLSVPAGQRAGVGYSFRGFPAFRSKEWWHSEFLGVTSSCSSRLTALQVGMVKS